MQSLTPYYIAGSDVGLELDVKPFMLPDKGFTVLQNAYPFRDRTIKRHGNQILGRLQRNVVGLINQGSVTSNASLDPIVYNIAGGMGIFSTEPNMQIVPGSSTFPISIVIGPNTLTDTSGNGILTISAGADFSSASISYATGNVVLKPTNNFGTISVTLTLSYYPSLPVMGIGQREQFDKLSNAQTIFFDTKYAYVFDGSSNAFVEYLPATNTRWTGGNSNFFWATNYRAAANIPIFFETNFNNVPGTGGDPIRYTNGTTWTDFDVAIDATHTMYQALILVPYYGRLLALNVWEGINGLRAPAFNLTGTVNISNRCRFSAIGDPTLADAWRTDIKGQGGFIDAPTAEAIITARFFKNTLIVGFERSTWQLRYVGEYGLPFLWERVSSDYGCESTFSTVLFDTNVIFVGNRAIVNTNAVSAARIDEKIPDIVFSFANNSPNISRVVGIRDYQRELVFWTYPDASIQGPEAQTFPNMILVYNYRNNTFAQFRDNVTFFGNFQLNQQITWDSQVITWDNENVLWNDSVGDPLFQWIVSGNQQGFVHYFGENTMDDPSLSITAINLATTPIQLTIPNHNLYSEEFVYLLGLKFISANPPYTVVSSTLNNTIYQIQAIDANTIAIYLWNGNNYSAIFPFTPANGDATFVYGLCTPLPVMDIETKDLNPFQQEGKQVRLSYIDFLTDATTNSAVNVSVILNSSLETDGQLEVGNTAVETALNTFGSIQNALQTNPCQVQSNNHGLQTGASIYIENVQGMTQLNGVDYTITYIDENTFSLDGINATVGYSPYTGGGDWYGLTYPLFTDGAEYTWHRFNAGSKGQFLRIKITYTDALMNLLSTHQSNFTLNAIRLWIQKGGRSLYN